MHEERLCKGGSGSGKDDYLHKFYVSRLRPALLEAIEEAVHQSPVGEQLSCLQELALSRDAAGHAVEAYELACSAPAASVTDKMVAGAVLRDAMQQVAAVVKVAADVERVKADVVGAWANMAGAYVTMVLKAARDTFGDDYRMPEFEEALRQRIAESRSSFDPESGERVGVDFTPEQLAAQVAEMGAATSPPAAESSSESKESLS
jgi:hypothetical protein